MAYARERVVIKNNDSNQTLKNQAFFDSYVRQCQ